MSNECKRLEPILEPTVERLILLPIKYPKLWERYKEAQSTFWTLEEIDMSEDREHWDKLGEIEKKFLGSILAFFSASDGIVNENLVQRFCTEVQAPEVRAFYGFQIMMENIHSETYAALIDNNIRDEDERNTLLRGVVTLPHVSAKAQWTLRWINNENDFGIRLIAFAAVEGIFFSSSFAAIFWLRKRGIMPGLAQANELIARDEGLHTEFACLLYQHLENRVRAEVVYEIIREAVNLEQSFVNQSLKTELLGMSPALMCQYVEFVADHLLQSLGFNKLYFTKNPFDFMELLSLRMKTNFFERKVGDYGRAQLFKKDKQVVNANLFEEDF